MYPLPPSHPMPPRQARRLPFQLLRSQAYPVAPWVTQQGVQQYPQTQHVVYMPQRAAFQKWKRPPAGYNRQTMGASVVNAVQATQLMARREQQLQAVAQQNAAPAMTPMAAVAEPANQIPSVWENVYMNPRPLSRGLLERPDVQNSSDLMAMSRAIAADPTRMVREQYYLPRMGPPRLPNTNRVRYWG